MHGTPFPKITVLFVVCLVLLCSSLFGQKRANAEVDVSKCWSYPLVGVTADQIAADESSVFVGTTGAKIEALSREGKKIWSSEFGGEISSNIIASDSSLFFTTSVISDDSTKPGGSKLRWVSKETGITNSTLTLPDAARYYISVFNGAIIVVSKNGAIESVDAKSSNVKWSRQIAEGFIAEPSFTTDRVFVATTGKQIFGVLLASGEIDSIRKVPFGVTALSAGANGELVIGDERGNVSRLNGVDKPIWTFKTGGEILIIIKAADNFLVASHDNFVYFLVARNGGRVWKKRLAGRVGQIAKVNDSFALISNFEERGAVLTDLSNGKVAGRIIFSDDESLVSRPVVSNGLIFTLTNAAVYAYSLNGCPSEKTKAAADR